MSFYERTVLKDIKEFKELSKEEKRNDLYLFKHKYFAIWLSYRFTPLTKPMFITMIVWIINCILYFTIGGDLIKTAYYITSAIEAVTVIFCIILYIKIPNNNIKEIRDYIEEKVRNIQLLDRRVLSPKDWRTIKKKNKALYSSIRSEKCNHFCYSTTYSVADTLKNPEIKVIWMSVKPSMEKRCGHAVLCRKNYIYDTNARKTYKKEKYIKAFHAEVFKEYTVEMCESMNALYGIYDPKVGEWEKFGEWCKTRGTIRND